MPLSAAALRDIFGTSQKDFVKPLSGRNFLSQVLGSTGLLVSEGPAHTRQRKYLTSSFRIQNIRALHEMMLRKADVLVRNLALEDERRGSSGVDICEWASKVTLDIIGHALMSQEFDALNTEKQPLNEAFAKLMTATPGVTAHFAQGLVLPRWIVTRLPTATARMVKRESTFVRSEVEGSLATIFENVKKTGKYNETDILSSIIADPSTSRTEVVDQLLTFLAAGHETTSTSIAWVTHLLTLPENLHYQDTLREEILAHPDCTTSPTALESLPWLNAIMEETLRFFPPVTTTARLAIRNTTVAGTHIPRGTLFVAFPWAINRDPRFWGGSESERFVPERWFDKRPDGSLYVNGNGGAESAYCNMTFLQGNRSCIGKGFTKAELRLIIAKMFATFRIHRLPGDDGKVKPVGSITIRPEGGLFVRFEKIVS